MFFSLLSLNTWRICIYSLVSSSFCVDEKLKMSFFLIYIAQGRIFPDFKSIPRRETHKSCHLFDPKLKTKRNSCEHTEKYVSCCQANESARASGSNKKPRNEAFFSCFSGSFPFRSSRRSFLHHSLISTKDNDFQKPNEQNVALRHKTLLFRVLKHDT